MIMIWLLAAKTRSQSAKTMMRGEALGWIKGVGSSRTLSVEDCGRPLSCTLDEIARSRSVSDVVYSGDDIDNAVFRDSRRGTSDEGGFPCDTVHGLSGLGAPCSQKESEGSKPPKVSWTGGESNSGGVRSSFRSSTPMWLEAEHGDVGGRGGGQLLRGARLFAGLHLVRLDKGLRAFVGTPEPFHDVEELVGQADTG